MRGSNFVKNRYPSVLKVNSLSPTSTPSNSPNKYMLSGQILIGLPILKPCETIWGQAGRFWPVGLRFSRFFIDTSIN